jgi:hypothetical protein
MRDSIDDLEVDLSRLPDIRGMESAHASPGAQQIRRALRGKTVCPFCGSQRDSDVGPCMHCSLEDTPTTRSATRSKLGPWYVLQSRNPSAPGMNFATLMILVQKGRVTARSVLRGPTTQQFWRHAAKVKGVSREFGLCWNCGGDVAKNARACSTCKRLQEPPLNPDVLLESAELCGEELAEAMWADEVPQSSQMPGTLHNAPSVTAPASSVASPAAGSRPAPVERLASRGGVRREVPPAYPPRRAAPAGNSAARPSPQGGPLVLGEIDAAPDHPLEMAVFQRSRARAKSGGIVGKVFKSIFVAVLLSAAGVVLMCSFDEGFRKKVIDIGNQVKVRLTAAGQTRAPAPAPENDAALPADKAKARAWELWKVGVDAEEHGDFAGAVKNWQKIKTLNVPEDDLPLGLEGRIEAARKRIR